MKPGPTAQKQTRDISYIKRIPQFIIDTLKYGPFCALQISRINRLKLDDDNYLIHRSLALPIIFRKNLSKKTAVVLHNIESRYYYEEYKAENKMIRRILYLIQSMYLRRHEITWLKKINTVYCLSETDYRYLRRHRIKVERYIDEEFWIKCNQNKTTAERKVFFGDFSNIRNYKALLKNKNTMRDVNIYGKNPRNHKINNYKGEFSNIEELANQYDILINPVDSNAGIQTKVVEWLQTGKSAIVTRKVYFQFPIKARKNLRIISNEDSNL